MTLSPFDAWLKSFEDKEESVLATVIEHPEKKFGRLFISSLQTIGDLGDEELNRAVIGEARQKLAQMNPSSDTIRFPQHEGNEIAIFLDVNLPPFELMIFGAGHDAIPVANYAVSLGFKTTIVDQREFYNSSERFPGANRLIIRPDEFEAKLKIGPRTYIVVMNHHIERDQETLKFVIPSMSPYIGILGPRSRYSRMMNGLEEQGYVFEESELSRIHNPIGLNIGAVSSEEIAISILAEVIAKKTGHDGGFLQGSSFIHHPSNRKALRGKDS